MQGADREAIVVGAGIIGLACARELRRRGVDVLVLDSAATRRPASLAGAGLLAPLSHPIAPGPLADACLESRALWSGWLQGVQDDPGMQGVQGAQGVRGVQAIQGEYPPAVEIDASGAYVAAHTREQHDVLDRVIQDAEAIGEPWMEVEPRDLAALVPDLRPDLERAILLPNESRVDNVAAMAALERACLAAGVEIARGHQVDGLDRCAGGIEVRGDFPARRAEVVVLATGCWSSQIAGCQPLDIFPVRGQMLSTGGAPWPWRGMVRLGDHYAVRRGSSGVLFGATVEEAGFEDTTTPEGIARLLASFRETYPGLAGRADIVTWSGLRPASGDDNPVLGPWRDWPLFIAAGHYRDGILLAPWTAREAGRWFDQPAEWPGTPEFAADRFAAAG